MAAFVPTLDMYRPVLNIIEDDFERFSVAMRARITENLGSAALRMVRFSRPSPVVIQPISPRELVGFHKEQGLRFGRTEMQALREYLIGEYPAVAEMPYAAATYPPIFMILKIRGARLLL